MAKNPLSQFITRTTSQTLPLPGASQVANHAGGFVFAVDEWTRLRRFLILGVDGPTYYATEQALAKENAEAVRACIVLDGKRTVDEIVAISAAGRNPKQHAVTFALAACAAADDAQTRAYALAQLNKVCRTERICFCSLAMWNSLPNQSAALVETHRLPWEAVKSEHLRSPDVWSTLIPTMGLGALVRNLGRMTENGTLRARSESLDVLLQRLADVDGIRKARLHPISVLSALLTYRNGQGVRGQLTWSPIASVVDALDAAFYASFGAVEPAGKANTIGARRVGLNGARVIAGVPGLTPKLASAAMATITLATEPHVETVAFTCVGKQQWHSPHGGRQASGITPLALSKRQRLDDIVSTVSGLPFFGTDCARPMLYAIDKNLAVDHFVIYTDSETWAGALHPVQALQRYRERSGIAAKLTVVAMTSTGFSIADPRDAGMLDVVGFDTAAPQLMADFAAGRL